MKRKLSCLALTLALFMILPLKARAAELLIPVGKVIGLQLRNETMTVVAYDDLLGAAARDAGLKIGDELVKIGDRKIAGPQDIRTALDGGGEVTLTVRRAGKTATLTMTPQATDEGPRLGVYLRQGIAGIGTVTFYDPDSGLFGTLGHGVCDGKGNLLEMTQGSAYPASVLSVKKGASGDPGQLKGSAEADTPFAQLRRNTAQGVFGITRPGWKGEPVPTAAYGDIHPGEATIRSTITGSEPREYSVEILKVYPQDRPDGRNLLLRVTDPKLLEATGGIVQGMSGSPILQDGKLVGAVTHVLVQDATMGYGIFIGNMLDAAA